MSTTPDGNLTDVQHPEGRPAHEEIQTPQDAFDCRRLRNSTLRNVRRPRWVATYEGNWWEGGRRRVGLLVPRPTEQDPNGRSQIAYSHTGQLMEFRIGVSVSGSHGEWYTARPEELTDVERKAICDLHRQLTTA